MNRYLAALERELVALADGGSGKAADGEESPPLPAGGAWDLDDAVSAEHAKALRSRLMLLTHLVPAQFHDVRDSAGRFAPASTED